MKTITHTLFALCSFAVIGSTSIQAEEKWFDLFDGKTLTGWAINPAGRGGEAKIVDGEIHLVGERKFFLCTAKKYSDFIFEAEIKLPEGQANSGFMFRCHAGPTKVFGYQAEIDGSKRAWSGGLFDEARRNWLYPQKPEDSPTSIEFREKTKGSFKRDDWNKCRIQTEGNRIRIWINDVLCTDFKDDMDAEGYIGLQHHGEKGRGAATIKLARELQPDILINDRTGDGGDYDTPEQRVGKYQDDRPWETCMTICRQWAWKPNDDMKSLKQCLQTLVTCVGGDGNLLFNVGPTPDGIIEARQADRLKEMGAWLAKNGASIYGTRGGPWKPTPAVASTRTGNTVFLHLLRAEDGVVELPDLARKVKSVVLLGGGNVKFSQADGKLRLDFDKAAIDPIDTIIRLELDGSAMDLKAISLDSEIKTTASHVFQQKSSEFGPEMAFDNDEHTRWATDAGTKQCWIAADLRKPLTIERVRIEEALGERVQKFEFQYREGTEWKTIYTGTTIGRWHQQKLDPPVKAQEFRLNILDATEGPTIADLEFIER